MTLVRTLVLPASLLLSLSACGCGTDGADEPAAEVAEAISYEGHEPEALADCLGQQGVPSSIVDTVPFGVEVPVTKVEADGVNLWVFRTPAEAEADRVTVTLSETDTPLNRLVGNVIVNYPYLDGAPVGAVEACLG